MTDEKIAKAATFRKNVVYVLAFPSDTKLEIWKIIARQNAGSERTQTLVMMLHGSNATMAAAKSAVFLLRKI